MSTETNLSINRKSNSCGLFTWRPSWLQKLLSYKLFLLLFMIINITQTTILAYLTVVLSTIEKEFGLKSKEAAWVYSGNEIAQICFIVFLPFVGRVKRRPLYIGVAAIISAIGMFLIAVPYFAGRSKRFGKGKHKDFKYTYFSRNITNSCYSEGNLRKYCILFLSQN